MLHVRALWNAGTARVLAAVIWPIALLAWLYDRTAHLGFNVLDEGLVATYGHRILEGQVPHRDFISPRPVVSSLLHLPDFLIPLPLYLAERLVGIAEVIVFSILIAWLILRAPPWRWGPIAMLAVAASALVNLHTFGETAWYTFDGLILSSAALVAMRAGLEGDKRGLVIASLLAGGLAVATKQSFYATPLMLLVWLGWSQRSRPRREQVRRLALAVALTVVPIALYLAVISAFGGLSDAISQLSSGKVVWGRPLLEMAGLIKSPAFGRPLYEGHFPWEVAAAALALLVSRRRNAPHGVRIALGAAVVLLTLRLVFHQDLTRQGVRNLHEGGWSLEVMWALILVTAIRVPFERRVDWTSVAVLILGWMAMLSWGYETPALVAGSMALAIGSWALAELGGQIAVRRWRVAAPALVAAIALFGFTAVKELHAREAEPYYDRPASQLTASVGDVSSDFKGIKTSPVTAAYMHGLVRCLRRYPAKRVAIIPDNPGLYMTMHLDNPFPIDWFWTNDYRGQRGKIESAATDLDLAGNYLVLFQTVSGLFLSTFDRLPQATRQSVPVLLSQPIIYDSKLGTDLIRILHGQHVVCGSFLGIWAPGSAGS
jgi:hypothetical protein